VVNQAREGIFMSSVAYSRVPGSASFRQVTAAFLAQPGLPFAQVLSPERIQRIFARHGNLFGMSAVYSTVVTLWAFLGQVLRDGKGASCQCAVAAVITCVMDLAVGPYAGKETGETALLRSLLDSLQAT
jgi:hypothetical protein